MCWLTLLSTLTKVCRLNLFLQNLKGEQSFAYAFEAPVDLTPLKKSYALADTIWLETDLPTKHLSDKRSNQVVPADTGMLSVGATLTESGIAVVNPPGGFCEIFTRNGVNPPAERTIVRFVVQTTKPGKRTTTKKYSAIN